VFARLVGFNRLRNVQAEVSQLRAQGFPGNPQQAGGPLLVAAGVLQDAGEQEPIQLAVALLVEVAAVGAKPLADEGLRVEASSGGAARAAGAGAAGNSGRKSGSTVKGGWKGFEMVAALPGGGENLPAAVMLRRPLFGFDLRCTHTLGERLRANQHANQNSQGRLKNLRGVGLAVQINVQANRKNGTV
jgi:hypothetical protein